MITTIFHLLMNSTARLAIISAFSLLFVSASFGQNIIEEITVTAQKREQNLQDVPISISAFSSDQIEKLGITQVNSLDIQPNIEISMPFGEAQQPYFFMRGIGLNNINDSFEAPIAMYIDEVYKGSGAGQAAQFFDVGHIEILKGPQGTLYGRNATGGLFHVVTNKPTDDLDLRASLSYGSHDKVVFEGALGGSLADGVRARIAGKYVNNDGWVDGFVDGVEYNDTNSVSARAMLEFDIASDGTLLLIGSYSKVDQNGVGFSLNGLLDPVTFERCSNDRISAGECISPDIDPTFAGLSANDLGGFRAGVAPGSDLTAARGTPPQQEVDTHGFSAQLDWDFGSWQLKAVGAYDEVDKLYEEDLDGPNFFFNEGLTMVGEEWKADIRASGLYNEANWLIGFFYFDDQKDMTSFVIPDFLYNSRGIQDTDSWAIYGQTDFPISDDFGLTLGARYSKEERNLDYTRNSLFDGVDSFTGTRELKSDTVTGKVGLDWKYSEDTLIYASVSTGFKSGGFNNQLVFGPPAAIDPVEDEEVISYEVGLKTDFWDGRARVNAAMFFYDYSDLQLGIFELVPGAPFGASILRNAGDVDIYGLEIESFFLPTENLEINFGMGLLDTEVKSDALVEAAGVTIPIDGNEMPGAPGLSFNLFARYNIPLESSGNIGFQANYSWRDEQFFDVNNLDLGSEDSYGLLDLRIDWRSDDERWDVALFVDNALDEESSTLTAVLPTYTFSIFNNPRWFGVKVGYQY